MGSIGWFIKTLLLTSQSGSKKKASGRKTTETRYELQNICRGAFYKGYHFRVASCHNRSQDQPIKTFWLESHAPAARNKPRSVVSRWVLAHAVGEDRQHGPGNFMNLTGWILLSFLVSFQSFVRSLARSPVRSFFRPFLHSFIHSFFLSTYVFPFFCLLPHFSFNPSSLNFAGASVTLFFFFLT